MEKSTFRVSRLFFSRMSASYFNIPSSGIAALPCSSSGKTTCWPTAGPMRGKRFFNAVTLGGDESAYQPGGRNKFTIAEMLRPFEMTVNMCAMIHEPAFVVGGHPTTPEPPEITDEELRIQAEAYARRLTSAQ
jgi:putative NADPH-quinone reductase